MIVIDLGTAIDDGNDTSQFDDKLLSVDYLRTQRLVNQNSASLHISTLSKLSDFRPGSYVLSSLKVMTATKAFLALPALTKGCHSEALERCRSRRYLEEVRERCGCLPWTLASTIGQEVSNRYLNINILPLRFHRRPTAA